MRALCLLLVLAFGSSAVPAAAESGAFSDIALVDHEGRPVLMHSDLLEDRVVVMASFFTSCRAVCPKVTRLMKQVQRRLGARCGRQVHLLSFTVDPETDTPERLRDYRRAHGITEDCWTFVTGEPGELDRALAELGFFSDAAADHTALVVVGNEPAGTWRKAEGLGPVKEVMRLLRRALDTGP